MEVGGQFHDPAALPSGKERAVPNGQEAKAIPYAMPVYWTLLL
jgi:hypothetical protein